MLGEASPLMDSSPLFLHLFVYRLLPHMKGNVGFVFTKEDLLEIRDKILDNKVRN